MNNILSIIADEHIEENESWKIADAGAADWALDKIRETKAEYTRNELIVTEKIKQLESWLEKQRSGRDKKVSFFTCKLQEYFADPGTKKRSTKTQEILELPSGTLRLKHQSPEYQRDDGKLLTWLKEHELYKFVKVKETPDWAEFKKSVRTHGASLVDENGEVVAGVVVIERLPVFEAEV